MEGKMKKRITLLFICFAAALLITSCSLFENTKTGSVIFQINAEQLRSAVNARNADFENALFEALKDNAIFQLIVEAKWSGLENKDIVKEIDLDFGVTYTPEAISNIFCNKIPKMIAETYYDMFLDWWYLEKEKGTYKTCSCCGQTLLAHPRFFNRNSTSRDGFYSQCKKCRAEKRKKGKK